MDPSGVAGERAPRLSPLELAVGVPLGGEPVPPVPAPAASVSAAQALGDALLAALQRPPCVVAFSGGRDSSGLLGLATQVARREGLPEPLPATWRFPRFATSDESEWQQLVIDHLALREWERIELDDGADFLSEPGTRLLTDHGLLWPPNIHLFDPLLELAAGGSLVTGFGGDELLDEWPWAHSIAVLTAAARPRRSDLRRAAFMIAPTSARRRVHGDRFAAGLARSFPWLRPAAIEQLEDVLWHHDTREPWIWKRRVAWAAARRKVTFAVRGLELVAAEEDVTVHHPLLAPRFLAAVARERRAAAQGRIGLMRALFGAVLPEPAITRPSKADVTQVIWGRSARHFAENWAGDGIDHTLVDAEQLRSAWLRTRPPYTASTLMRAAWLHSS